MLHYQYPLGTATHGLVLSWFIQYVVCACVLEQGTYLSQMKLHGSLFPFKFNSMGGKKKKSTNMFLFRLHFYSLWFPTIHFYVILARHVKIGKIVYAPTPINEK